MTEEIQHYPKMLYRRGAKNTLETLIVQDEAEHKSAGDEWKEEVPKPRGRPVGSVNQPKEEEADTDTAEEPESDDDS